MQRWVLVGIRRGIRPYPSSALRLSSELACHTDQVLPAPSFGVSKRHTCRVYLERPGATSESLCAHNHARPPHLTPACLAGASTYFYFCLRIGVACIMSPPPFFPFRPSLQPETLPLLAKRKVCICISHFPDHTTHHDFSLNSRRSRTISDTHTMRNSFFVIVMMATTGESFRKHPNKSRVKLNRLSFFKHWLHLFQLVAQQSKHRWKLESSVVKASRRSQISRCSDRHRCSDRYRAHHWPKGPTILTKICLALAVLVQALHRQARQSPVPADKPPPTISLMISVQSVAIAT